MKKTLILVLAIVLSLGLMACSNSSSGIKMCTGTCTKTADCGTGSVCDSNGTKECVDCLVNADCASFFKGGCNTSTHTCKECTADSDCGTGSKGCDTASGNCKECTKDDDCKVGTVNIGTGKCGSDFFCDKCTANTDCSSSTSNKVCGSENTCVQCMVDADCGTGKKCYHSDLGSGCGPSCTKDADCLAYGFLCNTGSGECVCDNTVCKSIHTNSTLTWTCK